MNAKDKIKVSKVGLLYLLGVLLVETYFLFKYGPIKIPFSSLGLLPGAFISVILGLLVSFLYYPLAQTIDKLDNKKRRNYTIRNVLFFWVALAIQSAFFVACIFYLFGILISYVLIKYGRDYDTLFPLLGLFLLIFLLRYPWKSKQAKISKTNV